MNCCDATGRCTNGSNCASRHQAPLRFAPGIIEHTPRQAFGRAQHRRVLRRWGIRLISSVVLCGAAAVGGLLAAAVIRAMGL